MLRSVALILTALTGFSGLVYEVSWQRYLVTLLGSDSEATATILGIYLGGLALGYRLFAWLTRSPGSSTQQTSMLAQSRATATSAGARQNKVLPTGGFGDDADGGAA